MSDGTLFKETPAITTWQTINELPVAPSGQEVVPPVEPLGTATIKNAYSFELLKELVYRAESTGWKPSVDEMKALCCRMASHNMGYEWLEAYYSQLPWPAEMAEGTMIGANQVEETKSVMNEDLVVSQRWGNLDPNNELNVMTLPVVELARRLDQGEIRELSCWVLDQFENLDAKTDHENSFDIWNASINLVQVGLAENHAVGVAMARCFLRNLKVKGSDTWEAPWQDLSLYSNLGTGEQLIYRGLADQTITPQERKEVVGFLLQERGDVARELNYIRTLLELPAIVGNERAMLEAMTRQILGLMQGENVYSRLENVYTAFASTNHSFNEYSLGTRVEKIRDQRIREGLALGGVSLGDRILSVACGAGGTEAKLKDDYSNIMGIDISAAQIQDARKLDPRIVFLEGDWLKPLPGGEWFDELIKTNNGRVPDRQPLPREEDYTGQILRGGWSVPWKEYEAAKQQYEADYQAALKKQIGIKAILLVGWDLPHAEDPITQKSIITNISATQGAGDIVIVDTHDPTKGINWERVKNHRNVLRYFELPEERVENSWIVVDGPQDKDGVIRHFYNRLMSPPLELIREWERAGYELIARNDDLIPGTHDDVSVTLVLRKLTSEAIEERRRATVRYGL